MGVRDTIERMTDVALAYLYGDDDLTIDRVIEKFATSLAEGGAPLERWSLRGSRNAAPAQIAELHGRIATPVLFGGGTLAVVRNPGALMVRTEDREALLAIVPLAAGGNGLVIVDETASGAKAPGQPKLAEAIRSAGGFVKQIDSPREGALAAWIDGEARDRGMRLAQGASKELAARIGGFVREGDADRRDQTRRAAMELEKLALYRPDVLITIDDVAELVERGRPGLGLGVRRRRRRSRRTAGDGAPRDPRRHDARAGDRRRRSTAGSGSSWSCSTGCRGRRTSARPGGRWGSTARSGRSGWPSRRRRWTVAELSAALDGLLELDAVVKGAPGRGSSEEARRMAFTLWIADHVGRSGVRRPPGVSARRGAARRRLGQSAEDQACSWTTRSLSMAKTQRPSRRSSSSISSGSM